MKLNGGSFYGMVSALADMEKFSSVLSQAVSQIAAIQQIQTKDTPEEWGVDHKNHDYCWGRHLHYKTSSNALIPFWVGLDIAKNGTLVAITFDRAMLKSLSPNNTVASLQGPNSVLPAHCNPQCSDLIERQLEPQQFSKLCQTSDPQILADFLNEVLGAL